MREMQARIGIGLVLIVAGGLFLLQSLGFIVQIGTIVWALLFAAAGGAFLYSFFDDRARWWALIPGFTLLGIGVIIALGRFAPRVEDVIGGSIILGSISLAFWVIYFLQRENWWAIIPGGVLLTLAIFVGLESIFAGVELVGVFFLGLGTTFILVALLPKPEGRLDWAFIPAGILLFMGVLMTAAAFDILGVFGALALVLGGGYLIFRTVRAGREMDVEVPAEE
jgi:hypothetical protein